MKKVALNSLAEYVQKELTPQKYPESSFVNGLVVEGKEKVGKIVGVVSPNLRLFRQAKQKGADLILAHHGLLGKESKPLEGSLYQRVEFLIQNRMAYISYHIPLDAHPKWGNNAQLATKLGLRGKKGFGEYHGIKIGVWGRLASGWESKKKLREKLEKKLGAKPLAVFWPKSKKRVKKLAIISGAGGRAQFLEEAARQGADAYLTGNVDEGIYSLAEELGLVFVALGHYQSEKWGVLALGEQLQKKFGIEFEFLEDKKERW